MVNFLKVARWNKWTSEEKALQLGMCLTGKACGVLDRLTEEESGQFDIVLKALRRRFDPDGREFLRQEEFWKRTRKPKETVDEFAQALIRLAERAYYDLSEVSQEKMLIHRFIAGVGDEEMGKWIHMRKPDTLQGAVDIALDYEAYQLHVTPNTHGWKKPREIHAVDVQSEPATSDVMGASLGERRMVAGKNQESVVTKLEHMLSDLTSKFSDLSSKMMELTTKVDKLSSVGTDMKTLSDRVEQLEHRLRNNNTHGGPQNGASNTNWRGGRRTYCYICGKEDHIATDCPDRKNGNRGQGSSNQKSNLN